LGKKTQEKENMRSGGEGEYDSKGGGKKRNLKGWGNKLLQRTQLHKRRKKNKRKLRTGQWGGERGRPEYYGLTFFKCGKVQVDQQPKGAFVVKMNTEKTITPA